MCPFLPRAEAPIHQYSSGLSLLGLFFVGGQGEVQSSWNIPFLSTVSRTAEHGAGAGVSSWRKQCLGKDRGQSWALDPGSDWQ